MPARSLVELVIKTFVTDLLHTGHVFFGHMFFPPVLMVRNCRIEISSVLSYNE